MSISVRGHLREKKGYFYAVISYGDAEGKRKQKWIATHLPVNKNKRRAEAVLKELLDNFEVPRVNTDIFANTAAEKNLRVDKDGNVVNSVETEAIPSELIKDKTLDDIPAERIRDILFADYMVKYLDVARNRNIEGTTYAYYQKNNRLYNITLFL